MAWRSAATCRPTRSATSGRGSALPTISTGNGKTMVRGGFGVFWNFTPGGTSSSKAQNPPFLQSTALNANADGLRQQPAAQGWPAGASRRRSEPSGGGHDALDLRHQLPRRLRAPVEPQRAAVALHATTCWKWPTSGRRAGRCWSRATRTRRRPVVGVTDANVNRPYALISPALRTVGQVQSKGTLDYNALLVKFQRRFANNFSIAELVHLRQGHRPQLRQRWSRHAHQRLRSAVQPGAGRLRHHAHLLIELDLRAAVGENKLYGGWQLSGILLTRGGLPLTVTATQGVQSTGTGNRPNRICDGRLDNPTIDKWFDTACFVPDDGYHRDLRRFRPRHYAWSGIVQHRCVADQEYEDRPLSDRDPARSVQPPQSPAVRQPEHHAGNAAFGQISTALSSPSCSLCGRTERQLQLGVKVRF